MKKICYLYYFLVISFLLTSCGTRSGHFKIEGKLLHLNQGEFYVYSPDGLIEGMDTIKVQGGDFAFEIPCEKEGTLMIVFPNFSQQPVFAQSGKSVDIQADASHLKEIQVKGTKANELMNKFRQQILSASPPEINHYAEQFIQDHPESIVSTYLVRQYFIDSPVPDYNKAYTLLQRIEAAQPDNGYAKQMNMAIENLKASGIGSILPHFTSTDINGKMITSSSLLSAPYAVISVWGTWNFDSEDIQRFLKTKQRASKGHLQLLSINIDANKQDCLRAIKRDSITWPNINDGEMFTGQTIKSLGLTAIPGNILLQRGKVIARNLKPQELRDRLNEMIK
jgi:hypothetical protein